MEQQAFKLLESSEWEGITLDLTVIERIENRVGAEVKAFLVDYYPSGHPPGRGSA